MSINNNYNIKFADVVGRCQNTAEKCVASAFQLTNTKVMLTFVRNNKNNIYDFNFNFNIIDRKSILQASMPSKDLDLFNQR